RRVALDPFDPESFSLALGTRNFVTEYGETYGYKRGGGGNYLVEVHLLNRLCFRS
ncbi:hypothetical protein MUK42_35067, partial [Musa troglodytarum]